MIIALIHLTVNQAQLLATANKCDFGDIYLGNTTSASKAVSTTARAILLSARMQDAKDAIKTYDANYNAYTGLLLTISPKKDAEQSLLALWKMRNR